MMAKDISQKDEQPPDKPTNEKENQAPQSEQPVSEVDQLQFKLEELQKAADTYKDKFLRKAAELENFKRRSEADFVNLIKNANEGLLTALLPILNDFVRSLKSGKEQKDHDAFYSGVELIFNKFSKILEAQGLIPFDSVGKPFDVEYHDAVLLIPRDGVPPSTVLEEVERGYKLFDKVIRHAKVIVSAAPDNESKNEDTSTDQGSREVEKQ